MQAFKRLRAYTAYKFNTVTLDRDSKEHRSCKEAYRTYCQALVLEDTQKIYDEIHQMWSHWSNSTKRRALADYPHMVFCLADEGYDVGLDTDHLIKLGGIIDDFSDEKLRDFIQESKLYR